MKTARSRLDRYPDTRPRVLAQLATQPQTAEDIAGATRLPIARVRNTLSAAKVTGLVADSGERVPRRGTKGGLVVWTLAQIAPGQVADVVGEVLDRRALDQAMALMVRMRL